MSVAYGFLAGYSFAVAVYVLLLTCLSVALMFARIRSWGVSFTPIDLLGTLLEASGRRGAGFRSTLMVVAGSAYQNIFKLRRAGAWCNEALHVEGRALVLYGSIGLLLASILGFISAHLGVGLLTDVLLGLESASGLVFAAGGFILVFRRVRSPNIRAVTHLDTWVLHSLIILFGAASTLSSVYGLVDPAAVASAPHIFTLVVLGVLLIYAPFSELTFLIWKGALITLKGIRGEAQRAESSGDSGGTTIGGQH